MPLKYTYVQDLTTAIEEHPQLKGQVAKDPAATLKKFARTSPEHSRLPDRYCRPRAGCSDGDGWCFGSCWTWQAARADTSSRDYNRFRGYRRTRRTPGSIAQSEWEYASLIVKSSFPCVEGRRVCLAERGGFEPPIELLTL